MRYLALYAVFAVLSLAGVVQQWRQAVPPTYDASNAPVVTPTVRDDGMVLVPAGPFVMGSEMASDQLPVRRIWLPEFWIDRTEVTAGAYEQFRQAKNLPEPGPPLWRDGELIAEFAEHPAYPISWARADEYCRAMGKRLPTEAEWEKAARGPDERLFPWGNDWNNRMANNSDINIDRDIRSRPVGSFPEGASPYGVLDMAGNVAEWVKDIYEPDAYSRSRLVFRPPWEPAPHVLRGGSFAGNQFTLSAAHRSHGDIDPEAANMGFRCASDR